ncbi:hypothetical protein Bhyg_12532 [Pseudolycoriella hygida]|uniref:Regulatory protein zeste n=1 Tax=Pseudolycoriella hygida TaxID=35572 RepID=A0A9Q0MZ29_9DIPT|nr:hypothetical protein Bhyg_12532 [Pseudolycoriella hygida]
MINALKKKYVTQLQKEELVKSVAENYDMLFRHKANNVNKEKLWLLISTKLNAMGAGKTIEGWKRCFTKLKAGTKARYIDGLPLNSIDVKISMMCDMASLDISEEQARKANKSRKRAAEGHLSAGPSSSGTIVAVPKPPETTSNGNSINQQSHSNQVIVAPTIQPHEPIDGQTPTTSNDIGNTPFEETSSCVTAAQQRRLLKVVDTLGGNAKTAELGIQSSIAISARRSLSEPDIESVNNTNTDRKMGCSTDEPLVGSPSASQENYASEQQFGNTSVGSDYNNVDVVPHASNQRFDVSEGSVDEVHLLGRLSPTAEMVQSPTAEMVQSPTAEKVEEEVAQEEQPQEVPANMQNTLENDGEFLDDGTSREDLHMEIRPLEEHPQRRLVEVAEHRFVQARRSRRNDEDDFEGTNGPPRRKRLSAPLSLMAEESLDLQRKQHALLTEMLTLLRSSLNQE